MQIPFIFIVNFSHIHGSTSSTLRDISQTSSSNSKNFFLFIPHLARAHIIPRTSRNCLPNSSSNLWLPTATTNMQSFKKLGRPSGDAPAWIAHDHLLFNVTQFELIGRRSQMAAVLSATPHWHWNFNERGPPPLIRSSAMQISHVGRR